MQYATSAQLAEMQYDPAVIFGHHNKLSADGPFLELLLTFQRELATADELIVVGYSFGDAHINGYLGHWLSTSEHRIMRVVDPYISDTAEVIRRFWKSDPLFTPPAWKAFNICLPDFDKAYEDRIVVINKSIADATELLSS